LITVALIKEVPDEFDTFVCPLRTKREKGPWVDEEPRVVLRRHVEKLQGWLLQAKLVVLRDPRSRWDMPRDRDGVVPKVTLSRDLLPRLKRSAELTLSSTTP
jgi:hypothetical protein